MTPVDFVAAYLRRSRSASNSVIAAAGRAAGISIHGSAFHFGRIKAGMRVKKSTRKAAASRNGSNGHDPIEAIRAALIEGEVAKAALARIREAIGA